jgi:hypothetical protein
MIEEILQKLKTFQPQYMTVLPCTKREITYTPFKIKDEKILSLISEEKHVGMILKNLCSLVQDCSSEQSPELLPLCDLEYLFLQIRAKSVEEQIHLVLEETPPIKFSLNINEIEYKDGKTSDKMFIGSNISVDLNMPKVKDYFDLEILDETILISKIVSAITIDKHRYDLSLLKTKEINKILDEIYLTQINIFKDFLKNNPKLSYTIKLEDKTIEVDGFLRFFI